MNSNDANYVQSNLAISHGNYLIRLAIKSLSWEMHNRKIAYNAVDLPSFAYNYIRYASFWNISGARTYSWLIDKIWY